MRPQRRFAAIMTMALIAGNALASVSYTIVDTGQDKCYNNSAAISAPLPGQAFYGQDAQYQGVQPAYRNNGDGTISDLNTGLIWVKARGSKVAWDDAVASAPQCRVGGYNDWRMPAIKELYSLIDFRGTDPTNLTSTDTIGLTPFIDANYFDFVYGGSQVGERVIDCQDWSGTQYVSTTMQGDETVFGVNFADGRIKGYPRYKPGTGNTVKNTLYVRYVRGNPSCGVNNFHDNGDGTVTDRATGLMWQKADNGTTCSWQNALSYTEGLTLAGHDDWRLPNAKELQSIVDYTRSPDTTSSGAINAIFNCTPITDEGGGANYPFYWTGTTHRKAAGLPEGMSAVYVAFGEALGWMQLPPTFNWQLLDVHGAGAQRSDPKTGNPANYPHGQGPQGDVIRIYNYVRALRDAAPSPGAAVSPTSTLCGAKSSVFSESM